MSGVASFGDVLSQAQSPWHRLRSFWRTEVQQRLRAVRPVLVIAAAAAVLILGTIGFEQYDSSFSLADSVYRALQLFGFGATVDPADGGIPVALQVARFIGPVVIGYAALRGIIVLFRDQLQILGFRLRLKKHVVVCGLGTAGSRLATAFQSQGFRVVAIEKDPSSPGIALCRQRGIGVLKDDARDRDALRRARVSSARLLVVTCGDDGTSVDVTVAAREVAVTRPHIPLTALVELEDIDLWDVMRARALVDRAYGGFRLEVFNICATGAETLLEEHPPLPDRGPGELLRPHVLLVGLSGVGERVLLTLAKTWRNRQKSPGDELRITIAGPGAEARTKRLVAAHADLAGLESCEIAACEVELDPASLTAGLDRLPVPVTSAYVCLERESQALAAALCMERLGPLQGAPVTVPLMDKSPGVASMLPGEDRALQRVSVFPVFSRSLTPDALLRSTTTELIARLAHERLVRDQSSLVSWEALEESEKQLKRQQAEDVVARLDELGHTLIPSDLVDPSNPDSVLSDDEVERIAPVADGRRFSRDDGEEDEEGQGRTISQVFDLAGFDLSAAADESEREPPSGPAAR